MIVQHVSNNQLFLCFFSLGVAALCLSFGIEHVLHIQACNFCSWQRYIYLVLVIITLSGIFSKNKQMTLAMCIAIFLASFLLASYHFGIQSGFIDETCAIQSPKNTKEFETMLFNPTASCSSFGWSFFSIPLSAINAFFSLVCLCFALYKSIKLTKIEKSHFPLRMEKA